MSGLFVKNNVDVLSLRLQLIDLTRVNDNLLVITAKKNSQLAASFARETGKSIPDLILMKHEVMR